MTISDVSSALFQFFLHHDYFCLFENQLSLAGVSLADPLDKAIVLDALFSFEKKSLIKQLKVERKAVWVKIRDFHAYPQRLEISGATAVAVARTVNRFFPAEMLINPLELGETAIARLLQLANRAAE